MTYRIYHRQEHVADAVSYPGAVMLARHYTRKYGESVVIVPNTPVPVCNVCNESRPLDRFGLCIHCAFYASLVGESI